MITVISPQTESLFVACSVLQELCTLQSLHCRKSKHIPQNSALKNIYYSLYFICYTLLYNLILFRHFCLEHLYYQLSLITRLLTVVIWNVLPVVTSYCYLHGMWCRC